MTIVTKCWANNLFSSYENCSMSIKLVVRKFHNLPPFITVLLLYIEPNSVSFISFQTILPKVK